MLLEDMPTLETDGHPETKQQLLQLREPGLSSEWAIETTIELLKDAALRSCRTCSIICIGILTLGESHLQHDAEVKVSYDGHMVLKQNSFHYELDFYVDSPSGMAE